MGEDFQKFIEDIEAKTVGSSDQFQKIRFTSDDVDLLAAYGVFDAIMNADPENPYMVADRIECVYDEKARESAYWPTDPKQYGPLPDPFNRNNK